MKYFLCLDESGSFEHKQFIKSPSTVGGLLCSLEDYKAYSNLRSSLLKEHNNSYTQAGVRPLGLRGDLHYRLLKHGKDFIDNENKWEYPKEKGNIFINSFLKNIHDKIIFVCKTSGIPPINLHPQHSYMVCLLSLISGILNNEFVKFNDGDELITVVASRARKVLSGVAEREPEKYHKLLASEIEKVLKNSSTFNKIKITVESGYANKNPELQFADLILGALIDKSDFKEAFLKINSITINVRDYYHVSLSDNFVNLLMDIKKTGNVDEAILLSFDMMISNNNKAKKVGHDFIEKNLIAFLNNHENSKALVDSIDSKLHDIIRLRTVDDESMNYVFEITNKLLNIINRINKDTLEVLRLKERCLYHLVGWEAHTGISPKDINDSFTYKHEHFMKNHGAKIYPSLIERLNVKLETKLISVQTLYFNTLKFNELEENFSSDIQKYEKAFKVYHNEEKVDDLYARLYGTYGQALAFEASINNDVNKFNDAAYYLLADVEYINRESIYYKQGESYVHSLYWSMGDLNNCRLWISKLLESKDDDNSIASSLKNLKFKENIYIYLDWARFAELNDRLNNNNGTFAGMSDENMLKLADLIGNDGRVYPYNLFSKWISVMLFRKGNIDKAIEVLGSYAPLGKGFNLIDEMFSLITKMMANALGKTDIIDSAIAGSIRDLTIEYPGFKRLIDSKNVINKDNLSLEDIARLLPYYYS
ncbi:hypothetical protein ACFL20_10435 [Spirochaetota bacterium]